jgi:cation transport ATPase
VATAKLLIIDHAVSDLSPVDILVQDAVDATFLSQDILRLLMLITYSNRLRTVIRQNINWAVLYNFSVIPFAAAGYLELWKAAFGMSMSSLLVMPMPNIFLYLCR